MGASLIRQHHGKGSRIARACREGQVADPQGRAAGEEEAAQGPRVEAPPLQLALRQRYDPAGWQAGPAEQAAARKVGLNHRRPPCCYPTLVFSLFSVFGVPDRSTRIGTGGVLLGARGKEGGARVRFFQAGNSPIWPAPPGFATSNTGIPSSLK